MSTISNDNQICIFKGDAPWLVFLAYNLVYPTYNIYFSHHPKSND